MLEPRAKGEHAFRTIGELASELGVPQHILRYWETRFAQLKPLQRAGNRRYYRPDDADLARRIHRLLNQDGYTIRGVQQLLDKGRADEGERVVPVEVAAAAPAEASAGSALPAAEIRAIRDRLAEALRED